MRGGRPTNKDRTIGNRNATCGTTARTGLTTESESAGEKFNNGNYNCYYLQMSFNRIGYTHPLLPIDLFGILFIHFPLLVHSFSHPFLCLVGVSPCL